MNLNDKDILYEIAIQYYEEGLSQQEIANKHNISRPTVSNLLKRCREEKIVEIKIQKPSSLTRALQTELQTHFNLNKVIIVPSESDVNLTLINIGKAAAEYINSILEDKIKIGISWGTTLFQIINNLQSTDKIDIEIIQLLGALGSINPPYDGFELTMNMAKKLNARYYVIQAPVLVQSVELKNMLMKEPKISEVMARARNVDIAVLGISSDKPEDSALVRAGFMTIKDSETIFRDGAVGHICGIHYDINGNVLKTPFNEKLIAISLDDLMKIPEIIGAACGISKTMAILGALRAGLIRTLVTDEKNALKILSEIKNSS